MNKKYFLISVAIYLSAVMIAQPVSKKRGMAYGYNSPADLQALSAGVSWWYNWSPQPETSVLNVYQNYGFDFVPMAWNGLFNKTNLLNYLSSHPDVKYILGWNEPNFTSQANMAPSVAAAKWKDIEAIADSFHLQIVGPAVNYCDKCVSENGIPITDPVAYLDSFFYYCPDCRVDYIAVHNYMGTVSALQWYIGLFKKYNKPIWLTEFANWENNPTLAQQKSYLIGAVDYLENDTSIFRYAWFTGRYSGAPYIALLESGTQGVLTDLGKTYVNMPLHDTSWYTKLPARIEAENYSSMSGVLLEATSDTSGFANVGYIEANDWMEYNVEVPYDTTFKLDLRIAGTSQSNVDILVNGIKSINIIIPATGGWQSWKTVTSSLVLKKGKSKIRILAKKAGFNINWIRFYFNAPVPVSEESVTVIKAIPNPVQDQLIIQGLLSTDRVDLFNILGYSLKVTMHGNVISMAEFPDGMYFLKIKNIDGRTKSIQIIKSQKAYR